MNDPSEYIRSKFNTCSLLVELGFHAVKTDQLKKFWLCKRLNILLDEKTYTQNKWNPWNTMNLWNKQENSPGYAINSQ